jgi:hypothetical protein
VALLRQTDGAGRALAADQWRFSGILKERRRGAPSATAASCLAIHWSAWSLVGKFVTVIDDIAGIETSISNAPSLRAITL